MLLMTFKFEVDKDEALLICEMEEGSQGAAGVRGPPRE
jgi:hypothetical protein